MKTISYHKLFNYYKEEELSLPAILRNIWRVRQLPREYKHVVAEILDGNIAAVGNFTCEGVTLQQLVEEEEMKELNAVLYMDWLRREPIAALQFMHVGRLRNPMEPSELDNEENKIVSAAINNLNKLSIEDVKWQPGVQDESKQDITIGEEEAASNVVVDEITPETNKPTMDGYNMENKNGTIIPEIQ